MAVQNVVLNKIGVFSCAKVSGVIYAAFGLLVGMIFTFLAMLGAAIGVASDSGPEALFGLFFGIGAVIVLPVFYGILGFIGGAIVAVLYNLAASAIGGVELELR
jgi:hypothetical protein